MFFFCRADRRQIGDGKLPRAYGSVAGRAAGLPDRCYEGYAQGQRDTLPTAINSSTEVLSN
jgi:hypothetical protein